MPAAEPDVLDVREIPKPKRHPLVFARFAALEVSQSFVLVNNHDPKPLREQFERDQPGAFGWSYLESGPSRWRVEISKLAAAPVPQVLCDVHEVLGGAAPDDPNRVAWSLPVGERQLDSNVIRLAGGDRIDTHDGPDLDVLMLVLDGAGQVETQTGAVPVGAGSLVWLPRRSRRAIAAGDRGLAYLTVHRRRPSLQISPAG